MEKVLIPSLLNTSEFSSLATNFLSITLPIIETDDKLNILWSKLDEINQRLTENLKYSGKSLLTDKIYLLDHQRDQGVICLSNALEALCQSLIVGRAEKAQLLFSEFEKLGASFYKRGYKVESALLNALFKAMDDSEKQVLLNELGLVSDYLALKNAETAFLEAVAERMKEKSSQVGEYESATSIIKELGPALVKFENYMNLYSELVPETYQPIYQQLLTVIQDVNAKARARKTRRENEQPEVI